MLAHHAWVQYWWNHAYSFLAIRYCTRLIIVAWHKRKHSVTISLSLLRSRAKVQKPRGSLQGWAGGCITHQCIPVSHHCTGSEYSLRHVRNDDYCIVDSLIFYLFFKPWCRFATKWRFKNIVHLSLLCWPTYTEWLFGYERIKKFTSICNKFSRILRSNRLKEDKFLDFSKRLRLQKKYV